MQWQAMCKDIVNNACMHSGQTTSCLIKTVLTPPVCFCIFASSGFLPRPVSSMAAGSHKHRVPSASPPAIRPYCRYDMCDYLGWEASLSPSAGKYLTESCDASFGLVPQTRRLNLSGTGMLPPRAGDCSLVAKSSTNTCRGEI